MNHSIDSIEKSSAVTYVDGEIEINVAVDGETFSDLIFSANSSTSISIFICFSFCMQFYPIDTELFTDPL